MGHTSVYRQGKWAEVQGMCAIKGIYVLASRSKNEHVKIAVPSFKSDIRLRAN